MQRLQALKSTFGRRAAGRKLGLLRSLETTVLSSADDVIALHDLLCFMRAYPDDRRVFLQLERMLDGFGSREDLETFRDQLVNSGIVGTDVEFPFYWFTACWLARRWPDRLSIDWAALGKKQQAWLDRRLQMLMPYGETLALEEATKSTREWIDCLKRPDETDGTFLVRRYQALRADPLPREAIFEEPDIPFRFAAGPDTPSATRARLRPGRPSYQTRAFRRSRRTFLADVERPIRVRSVGRREAQRLIDLARELMVVRLRDLDCFVHAAVDDVKMLDCGDGLQFASFGSLPERRQMADAAYGYLILKNGALTGYVLSACLFGSAEAAYNVSPAFRGAEATYTYARSLGVVRKMFGADTFVVDPYQMGHENLEGLRSGAWWFYYKLGFRPRDARVTRLALREVERVGNDPGYRSSIATLNRLSAVNMYLQLGPPRDDVIGIFSRANLGLWIVDYLSRRFGADRERGLRVCAREAARLLGVKSLGRFSPGERLAWERWAPLILCIPDIESWPAAARTAAARVVRAKGGRRESDFVRLFDRHRRLREAVWQLSVEPPAARQSSFR